MRAELKPIYYYILLDAPELASFVCVIYRGLLTIEALALAAIDSPTLKLLNRAAIL